MATVLGKAIGKYQGDIDSIREKIAALKPERDELQNGFLPKSEVIKRTSQFIDSQAEMFEPEYLLSTMWRSSGVPSKSELFGISTRKLEYGKAGNIGLLMCFLLSDKFERRMKENVMPMGYQAGPPPLSTSF